LKKAENIRLLQQSIACFDDMQAYKQFFLLLYPSLVNFAASHTPGGKKLFNGRMSMK